MNYPGGRRVRRRSSHRRRQIDLLRPAALLTGILTVVLIGGWLVLNRNSYSSQIQPTVAPSTSTQSLAVLAGPVFRPVTVKKDNRPVYNHSVVPGGVHTPAELREAVLRDPLVAEHYAGFRFERARMTALEKPTMVYLSYRKKGHIFWTRKKHPLKVGEKLVTDGSITGRSRCANRISVRKQLAVSPEPDPSVVELNQLEPPAGIPPALVNYPAQYQTALLASPGTPSDAPGGPSAPGGPIYGSTPPFPPLGGSGGGHGPGGDGGGGTGCKTPEDAKGEHGLGSASLKDCPKPPKPPKPPGPPAAVPEPGTVELMVIGTLVLGVALWRKRTAVF